MTNFKKPKMTIIGILSLLLIFSVGCNKKKDVKVENTSKNFIHTAYVKVTTAKRKNIIISLYLKLPS